MFCLLHPGPGSGPQVKKQKQKKTNVWRGEEHCTDWDGGGGGGSEWNALGFRPKAWSLMQNNLIWHISAYLYLKSIPIRHSCTNPWKMARQKYCLHSYTLLTCFHQNKYPFKVNMLNASQCTMSIFVLHWVTASKVYLFPDVTTCCSHDVTERPTSIW